MVKGGINLCKHFVEHCLARCDAKVVQKLAAQLQARPLVLSSGCSGSGMAEVVHHFLMAGLKAPAPVGFACEKVKGKQAFIANVVQSRMTGQKSCIFEDMSDLLTGAGMCYHHKGERCEVPSTSDIFVCGFSCKDFSKLNSSHGSDARARILTEGIGSSGGTFRALLGHIRRTRPPLTILENVDDLIKDCDGTINPNLECLLKSFGEIDYFGTYLTMDTNRYGLPQKRVRAIFVLLDGRYFNITDDQHPIFEKIKTSIETLTLDPLPLHDFLLPAGSEYVKRELVRRHQSCSGGSHEGSWPGFHQEWLKSKGLTRMQVVPGENVVASEWFRILASREREVLGFALKWSDGKEYKVTAVDVAPRIDRARIAKASSMLTYTPNARFWLVDDPEVVEGGGDGDPIAKPQVITAALSLRCVLILDAVCHSYGEGVRSPDHRSQLHYHLAVSSSSWMQNVILVRPCASSLRA